MFDFITDEHRMIQDAARDFAQKEIAPIAAHFDETGDFPIDTVRKMGKLGFMGIETPDVYGGAGMDWTMAAIAAEELGRADISLAVPVLYLVEAAWGFIFDRYGSPELKAQLLPKVTRGEAFLGIATTEPEGGSDILGACRTKAIQEGDGWRLNGEKMYISGVRESLEMGGVHLLLARIGVGFGEAGCTPPAHSLITDYTPREKRASALAYYHLGTPIGSLIGTICGGFIADQWGWRAAFYIAGAPGLVFALVTLFTLVEPRRRLKALVAAQQANSPSFFDAIAELRRKRTFWLLAGGASVLAFNGYGATAFSALFFANAHGQELATIAAQWGMKPLTLYALSAGISGGLAGVLGVWIGGALSDHFGKRDVRGQMTLPAVAGLISIPAYAAALFAPSYWLALALFTIPTLLSQIWYGPVYGNVQGLVHPRTRATAAAVLLFIINLIGLGLGPLLIVEHVVG